MMCVINGHYLIHTVSTFYLVLVGQGTCLRRSSPRSLKDTVMMRGGGGGGEGMFQDKETAYT